MDSNPYTFRPFKQEEVHLYQEWMSDKSIVGPCVNVEEQSIDVLLEEYRRTQWQNDEISRWLFCQKAPDGTEAILGFGHAWQFDRCENHMELGRILLPEFRGQGIGTQMLALLITLLFKQYPATKRLQAITACSNVACLGTWKKNGLTVEGILRKYMTVDSQHVDCNLGSLLRSEWDG